MSNTGYKTSAGYDLSYYFVTGLISGTTCGYKNSSGADLCTMFASGTSSLVTGYKNPSLVDLGGIFQLQTPVILVGGIAPTGGNIAVSGTTYTFYIKSTNVFTINKDVNLNYTLVSGGGGPGTGTANCPGTGGGGGHVLNCFGTPYVAGTQLYATIGAGGTAINNLTITNYQNGSADMNTKLTSGSYTGTILNSTNFTSRGGGGAGGTFNVNYKGQGGGGSVGGLLTGNPNGLIVASGGGGGGLTTITITNGVGVTLITDGNNGGNAITNSSGSGGTGQLGVDNKYYGGGGAGAYSTTTGTNSGGLGGIGGGQNGSYASGSRTTLTGAYHIIGTTYNNPPLTGVLGEQGGGGGGLYADGITYFGSSLTNIAKPSPGIAIVQFTWP